MSGKITRVASVLPSATETLCAIGGLPLLVGRSHEDNYPPSVTECPILTGQKTSFETSSTKEIDSQVSELLKQGNSLYTLDESLLQQLQPQVILTQDICAVCAIDLDTVRRVASRIIPKPRVVSLNPQSLQDVIDDLVLVADAVDMLDEGLRVKKEFENRISIATSHVDKTAPKQKVAFIEWSDPIYVGGHWTPQLIEMAGGYHTLNPANEGAEGLYIQTGGAGKSFPVPYEKLVESDPDFIIVCPCGLNLQASRKETDKLFQTEWFRHLRAVRNGGLYIVDGDSMFNRPGPRLVDALEWLVSILQNKPDLCPKDFPYERYPIDITTPAPLSAQCVIDDIEELHRKACEAGELMYTDPQTGYSVFTEVAHKKRGVCCGNRCRHCPYGHYNVKPGERLNSLKAATYLKAANSQPANGSVDILFWSGGKDSYLVLLRHPRDRKVVLCTTFDGDSGQILHQDIHYHGVMDQAKSLGLDLVLAPLPPSHTNEEYIEVVRRAVELASGGANDVRCMFGDLHLQDIKSWRESHHNFHCEFPLFNVPYDTLQTQLFDVKNISITVSASSHPHVKVGDVFDKSFLTSLPEGVDQMGENGEFHTYVRFN